MTLYPLYNSSSGNIGGLFTYSQSVVPFFTPAIFGFILLVITFSMYFIQESKKGHGDFAAAFAVGTTATTTLGIILSLVPGVINSATLGILIALCFVSYIWLFFSEP